MSILSSAPVRVAIAAGVATLVVPGAIRILEHLAPSLAVLEKNVGDVELHGFSYRQLESAGVTGALVAMGYVMLTMAAQGWG